MAETSTNINNLKLHLLTQGQFDALTTKNANEFYMITGSKYGPEDIDWSEFSASAFPTNPVEGMIFNLTTNVTEGTNTSLNSSNDITIIGSSTTYSNSSSVQIPKNGILCYANIPLNTDMHNKVAMLERVNIPMFVPDSDSYRYGGVEFYLVPTRIGKPSSAAEFDAEFFKTFGYGNYQSRLNNGTAENYDNVLEGTKIYYKGTVASDNMYNLYVRNKYNSAIGFSSQGVNGIQVCYPAGIYRYTGSGWKLICKSENI